MIVGFNEANQIIVTELPLGIEIRHCRRCDTLRPLAQFRRRIKNSDVRHATCDVCNNAARRKVRSSKRTRELGDLVERIVTAKRPGISINTLTLLVSKLGGVNRATSYMAAEIHRAGQKPRDRTRKMVIYSLATIMNLFCIEAKAQREAMEAEKQRRQDEFDAMSLEDIEQEWEATAKRILRSNPKMVLEAAQEIGWRVIGPEVAGSTVR